MNSLLIENMKVSISLCRWAIIKAFVWNEWKVQIVLKIDSYTYVYSILKISPIEQTSKESRAYSRFEDILFYVSLECFFRCRFYETVIHSYFFHVLLHLRSILSTQSHYYWLWFKFLYVVLANLFCYFKSVGFSFAQPDVHENQLE